MYILHLDKLQLYIYVRDILLSLSLQFFCLFYLQYSLALVDGVINLSRKHQTHRNIRQLGLTLWRGETGYLISNQRLSFYHRSSRWDVWSSPGIYMYIRSVKMKRSVHLYTLCSRGVIPAVLLQWKHRELLKVQTFQ